MPEKEFNQNHYGYTRADIEELTCDNVRKIVARRYYLIGSREADIANDLNISLKKVQQHLDAATNELQSNKIKKRRK